MNEQAQFEYESPAIRLLGNVDDLTAGSQDSSANDGTTTAGDS